MGRGLIGLALVATLLWFQPAALGQKATERFIPLGQSPGLSGLKTDIAEIEAIDLAGRIITLGAPAGRAVQVTERTRIWLDRSAGGQSSAVGGFDDLQAGRQVEVKYQDDARRQVAEWIKVQMGP